MKIQPYIEKLEKSKQYQDFKAKYPDSYLVAGFFVLDLEGGQNVHQIDFYIPSQKKIAAFALDAEPNVKILDMLKESKKEPQILDIKTNIDLDALSGILADEMHNRGISEEIRKIIAVVQNIDGKKIWNLNCVLTGMEILKSHIEDDSQTVLKLEKTSLMDIMKKMPTQAMALPGAKKGKKEEMKQLEKLSSEIEKEKQKLKEELEKEHSKK